MHNLKCIFLITLLLAGQEYFTVQYEYHCSGQASEYFLVPAASVLLLALDVALVISSSCRSLSTSCCSSSALFFQPSSRLSNLRARASTYSLLLTPEGFIFIIATASATLTFVTNHSARLAPETERRADFKKVNQYIFF